MSRLHAGRPPRLGSEDVNIYACSVAIAEPAPGDRLKYEAGLRSVTSGPRLNAARKEVSKHYG